MFKDKQAALGDVKSVLRLRRSIYLVTMVKLEGL